MFIEEFWRNRTGTRPADRELNGGEYAVKTPVGIGRGLSMLIGRSVSENVLEGISRIGKRLDMVIGHSVLGNVH